MGPDQFPFGVDLIGADVPLVGRDADLLVDTGEFTEFLKVAVRSGLAAPKGAAIRLSPSPLRVGPPRDMPIPLRCIGCLPVVASLLPPGTAADAAFLKPAAGGQGLLFSYLFDSRQERRGMAGNKM